ncbi:MAG: type II toxin-antitoxin system Phd/YefM family antitoxin [Pseudomonadota bacterium]
MRTWQLHDAKNRSREAVAEAIAHGPQLITRHGRPAAVVVAHAEWEKRTAPRETVVHYLLRCPKLDLSDDEVDALFARRKGWARRIDLS